MGHRTGIGPGKFPVRTAEEILALIESVEANAKFKGLNEDALIIKHISAQKGPVVWHYGRLRRRKQKNTHIEIIVQEAEKKAKEDKTAKKENKKNEAKQ